MANLADYFKELADIVVEEPANCLISKLIAKLHQFADSFLEACQNYKPETKTSPPTLLLSLHQLRVLYTAIEHIWIWTYHTGLKKCCCLHYDQGHPKALLVSSLYVDSLISLYQSSNMQITDSYCDQIWESSSLFELIITHDLFSGMMIERNMDRLLLTLLLHSDDPTATFGMQRKELARERLERLCQSRYVGIVICALQSLRKRARGALEGGGAWLEAAVADRFAAIVAAPGGVVSVISTYIQPGSFYLSHHRPPPSPCPASLLARRQQLGALAGRLPPRDRPARPHCGRSPGEGGLPARRMSSGPRPAAAAPSRCRRPHGRPHRRPAPPRPTLLASLP